MRGALNCARLEKASWTGTDRQVMAWAQLFPSSLLTVGVMWLTASVPALPTPKWKDGLPLGAESLPLAAACQDVLSQRQK